MSGLEVLGLVVGLLPLAVEAVNGYRAILSGVKNVDRDLKALVRDLKTEHVRLRTTCEVLLDGVAPWPDIDALIETPFGPAWKQYNDQLRLRLWTESKQFEEEVLEMQKAAQELRAKLCIEGDGKTKLADRLAIIGELKRGTSFTLKKKDYQEVLSRIKNSNTVLFELAGKTCGLEPNRRRRSQARLINLVRGLTRGIFNALRSTTCHCVHPHNVCLELVLRDAVIVPSDQDDEVAKDFNFHVAVGSNDIVSDEAAAEESPAETPPILRSFWRSLSIKVAEANHSLATVPIASTTSESSRRVKWPKSLTFRPVREAPTRSTHTLVQVSQTFAIPPASASAETLSTVSNLCLEVLRRYEEPPAGCQGYIGDNELKFGLYPIEAPSQSHTAISLRQVLTTEPGLPRFEYTERLRVALALSAGILHLYDTPWLKKLLTLDDVIFLKEDGGLPTQPNSIYRPFISKVLAQSNIECQQDISFKTPRPINLTVLSLGTLLIQIIIGKAENELDVTGIMDMSSILSRNKAGTRFSDRILENGGINYLDAVKWCLGNVFATAGLDNDNFCQTFYVEVVARLEEDVKLLGSD